MRQRCQLAPGTVAPIAAPSPACVLEVTSWTPLNPRAVRASRIRNDPNDWAIEHDDPTYILNLVGRIVAVSMHTLDIVEALPRVDL